MSWTGAGDGISWNDLGNWSDGAAPTSEDVIKPVEGVNITIDLATTTQTVAKLDFSAALKTSSRSFPTVELRNGGLIATDGWDDTGSAVNDKENGMMTATSHSTPFNLINATLKIQSRFQSGRQRMHGYKYNILDGSLFILDHVNMWDRLSFIDVQTGGTACLTFGTSAVQKYNNACCRSTWSNNGGDFNFPDGFILNRTSTAGWGKRASFLIQQKSGTMSLGGNISLGNAKNKTDGSAMGLFFQWEGGTVHATEDVLFDVDATFTSGGETCESYIANTVIADVDEGRTLNLSGLPMRDGVSMTKNGAGTLYLASDVPSALTINGGVVKIENGTRLQDASWVTFGEGGILNIDTVSEINVAPNGTPVFQLTDGSRLLPESVIFSSPIPAVLDAAADAIIASDLIPEGLGLSTKNGQILLSSDYSFESSEITDLSNKNGWTCGMVPVGKDVLVKGENVSVVLNTSTPSFSSISLADGATITVTENMTIPTIALVNNAKLVIPNGVEATLGSFTATTTDLILPELVIESGATLKVKGDTKFSNIKLALAGVMEVTSSGTLTFGHASQGKTTYFEMDVNGGAIAKSDGVTISDLYFVKAEAEGVVLVPTAMQIKKMNLSQVQNIRIGEGNSEEEPFDFILDNTVISMSLDNRNLFIRGASRVYLRNGARIDSGASNMMSFSHVIAMSQGASLIVEENGLLSKSVGSGDSNDGYHTGRGQFAISATTNGHDSVVLKDGGIFRVYGTGGNGNACVIADGGVWQYYRDHWDEEGATDIFRGFTKVVVNEGKVLMIQCAKAGTIQDWGWSRDRHATIANVPITGTGDVVIDNETSDGLFECTLTCGANTTTGSLVMNPNKNATLFFKNGCNWAGKVIANGATQFAGDAAAEVSFGTVDLTGEFPIRIYGTDTDTITNDKVNITGDGWLNNDGRVVLKVGNTDETLTAQTLPKNVKIPLGTISAEAVAAGHLPNVRGTRMRVYTEPIEGDDTRFNYGLEPVSGFVMIIQ